MIFFTYAINKPPGYLRKLVLVMKLTTVLLIAAMLQVTAATYAQKVTLQKNNASLESIFSEIRVQTGYDFLGDASLIRQAKPVSIHVKDADLAEVLAQCFRGQDLTYTIEEKTVVVKKREESILDKIKNALAIPITVSGKVVDTAGAPLIGATVSVKGSTKAVITDNKGEFILNGQSGDLVMVTFIGYQAYTFNVTDNLPFQTIVLHASSSKLNEVLVSTGYQALPKERATGSFAQVDNQLLNRRVSPDIISRLEGVVPGLVFNRNTVASASGPDISIRGHSTLFANDQPLIVVDNFPYDGDINNINPNDVESITVLKDAAASSIWGVKSGNGVIVITTKHGSRNGKMVIEVNSNVTVGEKPNLFYGTNFLDANDFINVEESLYTQGYYTNLYANSTDPVVTPVVAILSSNETQSEKDSQINPLRSIDYRHQLGEYFYRNSVNQQYDVNLRGGGSNSDYYVSAGYDNDLSNQVGNGNQRFTLNSNYNFSPNTKLDFSVGLNFVETLGQNNSPLANLLTGNSTSLYPYAQFVDANGNALPIAKNYAISYTNTAVQNGFLDWTYRPYDELHNADNTSDAIDNRINLGVRYKAFKGFSVDLKYQYEKSNSETADYNSLATYYTRNLINEFTQISSSGPPTYSIPIGGTEDQLYQYITSQRLRLQANYNKAWDKNEINAIAGAEISDVTTSDNGNTVYGYDKSTGAYSNIDFVDYFPTNPSGNYSQIPSALGFQNYSDRYISYFWNSAYTYKKRYIFSVSGRIDKSNLFGVNTNQKSVPLYSAGASWKLSDEKFYHLDWLPYAKLRLTHGYNGNVDKNVTAMTVIQEQSNSYITGDPYASVINPGNPDLRWEKISMLNLGLDFSLKRDILSGSIEYYVKKGVDIIGDSPLPPSTGFSMFRGNTANTAGNGFDLVINSNNIRGTNITWTTNFMLSYATDKVTKYNITQTTESALIFGDGNLGYILPIERRSIFSIYSYKWAGLDPANGNPRGYLNGQPSENYAAIEANTPLDSLKYNGTTRPKYFGSLRNTVSYKNVSLSANIIYKLDYYFRRTSISYSNLYQSGMGNSDYTLRWQKPGDELTTSVPSQPSLPADPLRDNFYANSSVLITPGDFIRLQDVSLSYNFTKDIIRNTPFKSLQVYCYVNNIGILWRANKLGLDPDLFSSNVPLPRTISFGIKTQL